MGAGAIGFSLNQGDFRPRPLQAFIFRIGAGQIRQTSCQFHLTGLKQFFNAQRQKRNPARKTGRGFRITEHQSSGQFLQARRRG